MNTSISTGINITRRSTVAASVFTALLLWSAMAAAQEAGVDQYVRTQMEARYIPGVSVAVVRDGRIVLAKGYGMANVELSSPATENTVYQLASVTKQFTATAIMMLVEDGKLTLDAKVSQLLTGLPAAWSGVTVTHLLNHTSGIKSITGVPAFNDVPRKDLTRDEILAFVKDAPLEFAPGEKWSYNNTGYVLLGMIIEKVSGQPYDTFVRERIFQPLDMTTARLNDLGAIIPNRAQGYVRNSGTLRNGEYLSPTQPFSAGALVATVLDLAKWDAALYTEKLLPRARLEQMWTPTTLASGKPQDYGFGWSVDVYRTRKRIAHSGGIKGFSTNISRFVDDKLTVIVLTNQEAGVADRLANGIAELYIPALKEHAPRPITDNDPKTTQFLKEVLLKVTEGAAEPDWFTPEARAFFFPDRIKEGKERFGSFGALTSFELMEESTKDTQRIRGYKVMFGAIGVRCTFTLAADGKIAGIGTRPE